jgi:integrase
VREFPNSNYTANTVLCTLRRIFGLAKEKKRIAFEIPEIRKPKVWGRSVAMSNADAEKIAAHMGEGDPQDALRILRATGMRPGECFALRWEYVNWETECYSNPRGKTASSPRAVPLLGESPGHSPKASYDAGNAS